MISSPANGRLYQKVAIDLARRISAGEYAATDRLPNERLLAEALQVSRPTIREALIALEIKGLIEIRGGSGSYVCRQPDITTELDHLFDLGFSPLEFIQTRLVFEGETASVAAERATEADLQAMRAAIGKSWEEFEAHTLRHSNIANDADGQFHFAIAAASGNSLTASIIHHLWKRLRSPIIAAMEDKVDIEQYAEIQIMDHERIFQAIKAKDPSGAKDAMHRHLRRYMKLLQAK